MPQAPGNCLPADIDPQDLALLMSAVSQRLRQVVDLATAPLASPSTGGALAEVHGTVLDCVGALDHLQASLFREMARLQQASRSVLACEAALAASRAELDRLRDGERRAWHLALHDGLTLLPNRRYLCDRLDAALAGVVPAALTVLYIDLDGFKAINDGHGHAVGDELLRIVAVRLRRAMRPVDMVGRLGGDEFGCLLQGALDSERLADLAGHLIEAVAMPVQIGALRLHIRPSIGIARSPGDGLTAQSLLRRADVAKYRAKRLGSGFAFFAPEAPAQAGQRAHAVLSPAGDARSRALVGEAAQAHWLPTLPPSCASAPGPAHRAPAAPASQTAARA